ncbi:MAG: copper transporter [Gaiellaceae bacterium]
MFDFRYHVASLAAVFLALVVGIVIGVGLSGQGIVQESERERLNEQIAQLESDLESARTELEEQQVAAQFVESAYDAVMANRLAGKRIVVVVVGRADHLRSAIALAIADAGGTLIRLRALKLPVDELAIEQDGGSEDVREVGRALGQELLAGGETPLWDALASQLVIERVPDGDAPADGVVVVRTADPQQGPTARFLNGLYEGLGGVLPAVWVDNGKPEETHRRHPSAFTVVHGVDTALGRVTLAVLLETGVQGEYGPGTDTPIPAIAPVIPPPESG